MARYAGWRDHALALLHGHGPARPLRPPVEAVLVLHEWMAAADLDNYSKALLDALVHAGWLLQDNCKQVVDLRILLVTSELDGVTLVLRELERLAEWQPESFGLPASWHAKLSGEACTVWCATRRIVDA